MAQGHTRRASWNDDATQTPQDDSAARSPRQSASAYTSPATAAVAKRDGEEVALAGRARATCWKLASKLLLAL